MITSETNRVLLATRIAVALMSVVMCCGAAFAQTPADNGSPASSWRVFMVATDYYPEGIDTLQYAVEDAKGMRDALIKHGVPKANITLFSSKPIPGVEYKVSISDDIKTAFTEFCESLDENSAAFVFLSGHGFLDKNARWNYAPKNIDLNRPATFISLEYLTTELAKSKAGFKWVCVDACRNTIETGNSTLKLLDENESRDMKSRAIRSIIPATKLPHGVVLMYSCQLGKKSYEDPNARHGFFTAEFINAISGKAIGADQNIDGSLTFNELQTYLTDALKRNAAIDQTPDIVIEEGDRNQILSHKIFLGLPVLGYRDETWKQAKEYSEIASKSLAENQYDVALNEINRAVDAVSSAYELATEAPRENNTYLNALFDFKRLQARALIARATARLNGAENDDDSKRIANLLDEATLSCNEAEKAAADAAKVNPNGDGVAEMKEEILRLRNDVEVARLYNLALDAYYGDENNKPNYEKTRKLLNDALKIAPDNKECKYLMELVNSKPQEK